MTQPTSSINPDPAPNTALFEEVNETRLNGVWLGMETVTESRSFEEFFRDELASLVALGAWLTGDRNMGEDLAQEAMRVAHGRWDEVSSYERPGAFVRRVEINLASNERRRRRRERKAVGRLRSLRGSIDAHRTHTDPIEAELSGSADPLAGRARLWKEVAALPMNQRAAIGLRYLDDLDTAEIAATLDCAEPTVRVHLHRAHKRLAERLGHPFDDTALDDTALDDTEPTGGLNAVMPEKEAER